MVPLFLRKPLYSSTWSIFCSTYEDILLFTILSISLYMQDVKAIDR
jgi:hypothetical protein